ncbi:hypothetical protein AB0D12_31665 [Streptomyces sp. NPDC048479]|uniref:hypothetical protein n=1 Tax=Streptomyces sp. NPDC048479 TaxID=3154725 RepID=UPI003431D1F0
MTEPSMSEQPRHISISSGTAGGKVLLEGDDITRHVRGYSIQQPTPYDRPAVVLHLVPQDGVVFEGLAHVAVGQQADPGEAMAAFLDHIDAGALETAALHRDDLGSERFDLTRAMLRQLADLARGHS